MRFLLGGCSLYLRVKYCGMGRVCMCCTIQWGRFLIGDKILVLWLVISAKISAMSVLSSDSESMFGEVCLDFLAGGDLAGASDGVALLMAVVFLGHQGRAGRHRGKLGTLSLTSVQPL